MQTKKAPDSEQEIRRLCVQLRCFYLLLVKSTGQIKAIRNCRFGKEKVRWVLVKLTTDRAPIPGFDLRADRLVQN